MNIDRLVNFLVATAITGISLFAQAQQVLAPKPATQLISYALWISSDPAVPQAHIEQRRKAFALLHGLTPTEAASFGKNADSLTKSRAVDIGLLTSQLNETLSGHSSAGSAAAARTVAAQVELLNKLSEGTLNTLSQETLDRLNRATERPKFP